MRTRIAQDAAREWVPSVRTTTKRPPHRLLCRATGSGLVCAALLAGIVLSPAAAVANRRLESHRNGGTTHETEHGATRRTGPETTRQGRAPGVSLPPRLSFVSLATHWLTPQRSARAEAPVHPSPMRARPAPPPVLTDSNSTTTPDWACIRQHESDDEYNSPTVPGGAYGFLESTWVAIGYSGWPYQASPEVQSQAALFLYDELGWEPWSTRFVCGL